MATLVGLATRRLPNAIVLPSYAVGGVLLLLPSAARPDWSAYLRAWFGQPPHCSRSTSCWPRLSGWHGFGNVKLAGVLGLFLG